MYYIPLDDEYYGYIFPIVPLATTDYDLIINSICLSIPFENKLDLYDYEENAIICMDINMTNILEQNFFQSKDKFNFFLFSITLTEVTIYYSDKNEIFEQIRAIFNNTKFGIYSLGENDHRLNKYYNLFQILYLKIFKEPELLKENNLTIDYIIEEYEIIQDKIFGDLIEFLMMIIKIILLLIFKRQLVKVIYIIMEKNV